MACFSVRRHAGLGVGCALLAVAAGCGPQTTRIELTTFDDAGTASRHYTEFSRASFKWTSDHRIELVFRSDQPSQVDPTQTITQIVHVQMFWNPRYGVTYAESTQVNARVQYAIVTPPTGVRYEGGAFVTYKLDKQTGEAVGKIESGDLMPRSRMGNAIEPFGPARVTGTFRAIENPGEVVRVLQQVEAMFRQPVAK